MIKSVFHENNMFVHLKYNIWSSVTKVELDYLNLTVYTKLMTFPYTKKAASVPTDPTHLKKVIRFVKAQDQ